MKLEDLNSLNNFVLLDNFNSKNNSQLLFTNPIEILSTNKIEELESIFIQIEKYTSKNFYIVGYLSYEAGFNFLKKKFNYRESEEDLCKFGVFENFLEVSFFDSITPKQEILNLTDFSLDISKENFLNSITIIREKITSGELYQMNFTFELLFQLNNKITDIYRIIRNNFHTNYSALIRFQEKEILSFSPESFFSLKDGIIKVKPMKGTGIDKGNLSIFSEKNKAENHMIVDLLRNDIGQISIPGSVKVKSLLNKEVYGNIEQLTSEIESKIIKNINIFTIFQAIFPSGSITGAPKEKAMEWIENLEMRKRGVYTGCIGFFSPGGDANFNVAIRTIEKSKNGFRMGIGSGIVFDSEAELEWEECHQKAFFLYKSFGFYLFESILFKKGTFYLLDEHLNRLKNSALLLFGHFDLASIEASIENFKVLNNSSCKIKLMYYNNQKVSLDSIPISKTERVTTKINISNLKINSKNLFFNHKTSYRNLYDDEYSKIKLFFTDTIFTNENNEITEGCISNIFILENNIYYTPPLRCGVLPGIFREKLLKKFPKYFKEKILTVNDLKNSKKIFICNSVRGIMRVKLNEN